MAKNKGHVEQIGQSFWLTYSVSALDDAGRLCRKRVRKHLGSATDMCLDDARLEADQFLATREVKPSFDITVAEFVEIFKREHIEFLKPGGKVHYRTYLTNHVIPALGNKRLLEVTHDTVQELVRLKTEVGLSPQTVRHIRNVISGIFTHAIVKGLCRNLNPAKHVKLPEMRRVKPRHALSADEVWRLIDELTDPARTMVLLACLTGLGKAELLGLRWGRINLTEVDSTEDGEPLPAFSLAVRENFSTATNTFGSVKCRERERLVPLADVLVQALLAIKQDCPWTEAEDLVFVSPRRGWPLQVHNLENRVIRPAAERRGVCSGWHTYRRTFATLMDQEGWAMSDRTASMGHSGAGGARMTLLYTAKNLERRRAGVEKIARAVGHPAKGQK